MFSGSGMLIPGKKTQALLSASFALVGLALAFLGNQNKQSTNSLEQWKSARDKGDLLAKNFWYERNKPYIYPDAPFAGDRGKNEKPFIFIESMDLGLKTLRGGWEESNASIYPGRLSVQRIVLEPNGAAGEACPDGRKTSLECIDVEKLGSIDKFAKKLCVGTNALRILKPFSKTEFLKLIRAEPEAVAKVENQLVLYAPSQLLKNKSERDDRCIAIWQSGKHVYVLDRSPAVHDFYSQLELRLLSD